MNTEIINYISSVAFFAVIGLFAIVSLLAIYVFIRYGRTKSITVLISLVFAGVFILGTLAAFLTLQQIF